MGPAVDCNHDVPVPDLEGACATLAAQVRILYAAVATMQHSQQSKRIDRNCKATHSKVNRGRGFHSGTANPQVAECSCALTSLRKYASQCARYSQCQLCTHLCSTRTSVTAACCPQASLAYEKASPVLRLRRHTSLVILPHSNPERPSMPRCVMRGLPV